MPRGMKRSREKSDNTEPISEFTWEMLSGALKKKKKDYLVEYYFEPTPTGGNVTQDDRNFVARVTAYYSPRGKRDPCPPSATVTQALAADIQGCTTNRSPAEPLWIVFKTVKHINAMYHYIQATRGENHNVTLFVRVDGSSYAQI